MSLPRMTRVDALVVVLAVSILGPQWRLDCYSCHLCRARKELTYSSFVGVRVRWRETVSDHGDTRVLHRHDWWRYSYSYSNGLGGCLGGGVACHTDGRYRDEQHDFVSESGSSAPRDRGD